MKRYALILLGALCLLALSTWGDEIAVKTLDPAMKMELVRLDELWNVLDQCAARVWPGWTGYADVPFLFDYENGVRMLVGHPEPPPGFESVQGVEVRGKKVYLNRQNEVPVKLTWPTGGGGGPQAFGTHDGKDVETVWIQLSSYAGPKESKPEEKFQAASENQILLYVHELFHVFQGSFYTFAHGNLQYNPDTNYAVYSEIEGEALKQTFLAKEDSAAKEYLKDFIAARKLKYKSMAPLEQAQEMEEDFMEGTARYSEYAVLQQIALKYQPKISQQNDPYFFGFKDLKSFFDQRLQELDGSKGMTLESLQKCYQYGCFQALLLSRFSPGWQKSIPGKYHYLSDIISDFLGLKKDEESKIEERLSAKYNAKALFAKHGAVVEARDNAFKSFFAQKGKVYIINFKPTGEYPIPGPDASAKVYRRGLQTVYPEGVKAISIKEVLYEGKGKPVATDQIFYLRYVDTENQKYSISSSKKEGDVYTDAVITTSGFTLKAPKIQVKESGNRIKFIIVSKVKES